MKVLVVHNFYKQPGGEDTVFYEEVKMLQNRGHVVRDLTVRNDALDTLSKWSLAQKTFWNDAIYQKLRETIRCDRPDIVHFHNTFPLVSPAGYYAARDEGVRVVQTLHNYRLMCPTGTLYRKERVCEDCAGRRLAWPGILRRCYRDSTLATGLVAAMLAYHRYLGTWTDLVDLYIALTEFSRQKFIEGGLPADKIVVKPNFVLDDPGEGEGCGGYAVFVGRLCLEKGVKTLLEAWRQLAGRVPLKIVGDGPLGDVVGAASRSDTCIEWLGQRSRFEVQAILADAAVMIFPSEWYEGFPMTIIESFASGTPVIASRIGDIPRLVRPGRTGELFQPGAAADLARAVKEILARPYKLQAMRSVCRQTYVNNFTAQQNYPLLVAVYQHALRTDNSLSAPYTVAEAPL
jgi:glycosyltransferase involved in cell wall biosynthesis